MPKRSQAVKNLLSWYSREFRDSPGFFDYIDAHRFVEKKQLSTWNSSLLSDAQSKQHLGAVGTQKFNLVKEYLASLVLKDAQEVLAARRNGRDCTPDSLKAIREFFDSFFRPMRFVDVQIDCSPFKYMIETPKGEIDIDDLSSGEKDILCTFIHFHQLRPENAVILFDEVDAHLHPDMERRYLQLFKQMSQHNQIILTTHSPEIMVGSGSESLFVLSKVQTKAGDNQLSRVTANDEMHSALASVMGSNGMVSINRKIVFIEGAESSADRYVYEALYPPTVHNISFIPAGDSNTNINIAERVNRLLSAAGTYQEFYSISDGDVERLVIPQTNGRLYRLPVYHVENFLLDARAIYDLTEQLLRDKCPYRDEAAVELKLVDLLKSDQHLLPFTKAIFDAAIAKKAKAAWDFVFQKDSTGLINLTFPVFEELRKQAIVILDQAIADSSWRMKCKGRNLLKAFCSLHGFNYEHFRNLLIAELDSPPAELDKIIAQILAGNVVATREAPAS